MKKTAAIAAATMILAAGTALTASAGLFDEYNDYQNSDGTYSYYFMQGVTVTMDENWYRNTFVITGDEGATFYQKDSYDRYLEEGIEGGGRLLTIAASEDTDFKYLPHYEYVDFDPETMLHYFVELPSDYQAYTGDEEIRAAYDTLWAGVDSVIMSIQLTGTDHVVSSEGGQLLGGWTMTEENEVPQEVADACRNAQTADAAVYEPVSLLAKQLVAGMNYCLLCRNAGEDAAGGYALVYLYVDLEGNAQILDVQNLSIGVG